MATYYPADDRHITDDLVEENRQLKERIKELTSRILKPARANDPRMFNRKAVFLDRDGTLVYEVKHPDLKKKVSAPFTINELTFVPDAEDTLKKLKLAGFLRIMITNQPDVAHGYMAQDSWREIHGRVLDNLELDDHYMCRHRKEDECPMKKPSPLMLIAAADKWGIDLSQSFMVGDTRQDMETGKAAGCRTILINKPYNQDAWPYADFRVDFLSSILLTLLAFSEI